MITEREGDDLSDVTKALEKVLELATSKATRVVPYTENQGGEIVRRCLSSEPCFGCDARSLQHVKVYLEVVEPNDCGLRFGLREGSHFIPGNEDRLVGGLCSAWVVGLRARAVDKYCRSSERLCFQTRFVADVLPRKPDMMKCYLHVVFGLVLVQYSPLCRSQLHKCWCHMSLFDNVIVKKVIASAPLRVPKGTSCPGGKSRCP